VEGIILCGKEAAAVGQVYILAGEEYVTLNEVASLIACEVGVPTPRLRLPIWPVYLAGWACELVCSPLSIEPPLYRRRVDFFRKSRAFDISKAKRELGYQPKVGLKEGFHMTAEWYRRNNLL
jgi:nucleoside-diphosphate-sugar epimerase